MPRDYKVYLDDILLAIQRIQTYTAGYTKEKFCDDMRTIDAVVRNLEVIGEAVKHIPQEIRNQRTEIEWRKIGSLRDILAHEYFGVDLEIIWDVVANKIPGLEEQIRKLL
ncbi:MAG: hypothetical protein A2Y02_02895 [Omnitrophica bacterium GWA2_52_12]|nr:MAG: hypothetical protein A2Y02_02895 [Omnitrophica bacterium GWA2_52_12]